MIAFFQHCAPPFAQLRSPLTRMDRLNVSSIPGFSLQRSLTTP
jgi:hypothetical protein